MLRETCQNAIAKTSIKAVSEISVNKQLLFFIFYLKKKYNINIDNSTI